MASSSWTKVMSPVAYFPKKRKRKRPVMSPSAPLMTVEDYFTKTPETVTPMELIHGRLRVAESPTVRHQSAVFQLSLALHAHVTERKLGRVWVSPLDVVLSRVDNLIVQPDLFFISNERAGIVRERVWGPPDLVIEVLSPHPRIGQTAERVRWFAEYNVRECWLVHQDDRTITVLQFADDRIAERRTLARDAAIVSGVLPEFTARLEDVLLDWK
jgi:Uma2 family endonuclease